MDIDPKDLENVVVDDADVRKIVMAYLVHNCYKETAEAFVSCTGIKYNPESMTDLHTRKTIYGRVMAGDALKAIELSLEVAPDIFENNRDVLFDLLTLQFVELVRAKNCTGALEFAQKELREYGKMEKYIEKLQDYMTLLAYEEPEQSPVFELLSMDHRQNVADSLNQNILAYNKLPSHASLERILQQVAVVRYCLNPEGGKDGASSFSLASFIKI